MNVRRHIFCTFGAICLLAMPMMAATADSAKVARKAAVKEHWDAHFKPYGFIRDYFIVDSRLSKAGGGEVFYFMPMDQKLNDYGQDLNQVPSVTYLAITTRLGLDITNYQVGKTHFGGKIEADFEAGLTGTTGKAQMRLRQAYMTFAWKDLPMKRDSSKTANVTLLLGQAWHPMAANLATMMANESGTPFTPFSRTPQMQMKADLGKHTSLTAALIWQMQFTSTGPQGMSANYQKYGCTPEAYAGVTFMGGGFKATLGADVLSIKPRWTNTDANGVEVKVSDRLTTISPMLYMEYKYKLLTLQAKTTYAQGGEHMHLLGGYALRETFGDGHSTYAPLRHSTSFVNIVVGDTYQGGLFLGYYQNLGTSRDIDPTQLYCHSSGAANLRRLARIQPCFHYHIGKIMLGLEYAFTAAQYGDAATISNRGLAQMNLHWVGNHRTQAVFKFDF